MDKYLLLEFSSAKLFRNSLKDGLVVDYKDEKGKISKRKKDYDISEVFKYPITKYQVSNVLHTLFGKIPVPSLKKTILKVDGYLFEKAANSYIKLNIPHRETKSGDLRYIDEVHIRRKPYWNAWRKSLSINWTILKAYLEDEYDYIVDTMSSIIGYDVLEHKLMDVVEDFSKLESDCVEFKNLLKEKKKTALFNVLFKNGSDSYSELCRRVSGQIGLRGYTAVTENKGLGSYITISGSILVPVSEEDLNAISSSKGVSTILDGGVVNISKLLNPHEISQEMLEDFKLVSDIPCDRVSVKEKEYNFNEAKI